MTPPDSVNNLIKRIVENYDQLPKQLKNIASYIEQHRSTVMMERVSDIARACRVQDSAVIRFAKSLGFNGFSDMQAVFRREYTQQNQPIRNYQHRIRQLIASQSEPITGAQVAREFIEGSRQGISELTLDTEKFEAAVTLLQAADTIYTIGVRRSFAAASYLTYALQRSKKRVILLSGMMGGMIQEQTACMRKGDVLLAISFHPYGEETQHCVRLANETEVDVIALSDSELSPIIRYSQIFLPIKESSALGFRSLTNTICLCQALVIALAYKY